MNVPENYNEATPSALAKWVFLNSPEGRRWAARRDEQSENAVSERLRLGSLNHIKIEELKLRFQNKFARLNDDYEVAFVDDGQTTTNLFASQLLYRGTPFSCRPDLVLMNKKLNHVIIVERKTTNLDIFFVPNKGYLNWRIQLWCYSFIDKFIGFDRITMAWELWYNDNNNIIPSDKRYTFEKSDKHYENEFLYHFKRYGGKIKENIAFTL